MASLTKMFTTILSLQQIERGVIGLEDKVGAHLPGFNGGSCFGFLMIRMGRRLMWAFVSGRKGQCDSQDVTYAHCGV